MKNLLSIALLLCVSMVVHADEVSEGLNVVTDPSGTKYWTVLDPTDNGVFKVPYGNEGLLKSVQNHVANKQAVSTTSASARGQRQVLGNYPINNPSHEASRTTSTPAIIATCPNGRCTTPPVIYPNFGQVQQPTIRYLTIPQQGNCPNGRCPNQR